MESVAVENKAFEEDIALPVSSHYIDLNCINVLVLSKHKLCFNALYAVHVFFGKFKMLCRLNGIQQNIECRILCDVTA